MALLTRETVERLRKHDSICLHGKNLMGSDECAMCHWCV
jgi:hypothetical protein